MQGTDEQDAAVKAKAVLIDPDSMTVLWMNESAAQDSNGGSDSASGVPMDEAVPLAETLGVPKALHAVADTGVAQHLRTDLVSTTKGSVAIVSSIYRLPNGTLLLLMEHAWQPAHRATDGSTPRGSGRQAR